MQRPSLPDFVLQVRHHHSIALPDGRVIDGDKSLAIMQEQYQQTFEPLSLSGKSVVDFGTWSGAFAVEAVQRGAGKVVGVDQVVWKDANQREVFKFVTKSFGYDIPDIECDLDASPLDLSPLGEFDISLFLGVFYHLKDPIAAIREIAKLTREALVVETYVTDQSPAKPPAMIFYPRDELAGDPTNWWGPNVACVRELLLVAGFKKVHMIQGSALNRAVFHAFR